MVTGRAHSHLGQTVDISLPAIGSEESKPDWIMSSSGQRKEAITLSPSQGKKANKGSAPPFGPNGPGTDTPPPRPPAQLPQAIGPTLPAHPTPEGSMPTPATLPPQPQPTDARPRPAPLPPQLRQYPQMPPTITGHHPTRKRQPTPEASTSNTHTKVTSDAP